MVPETSEECRENIGGEIGKAGFQARRGGAAGHGQAMAAENGAGIETLVHAEDRQTGFAVAMENGVGYRGGAPPARQERWMKIDAAKSRHVENGPRKDQSIGGNHRHVGVERPEGGRSRAVPQRDRCPHVEAKGLGPFGDHGGAHALAAAGAARRLRVDGHDVVAIAMQGLQHRQGEGRRSHERKLQGGHAMSRSRAFFHLIILRRISRRRRTERWSTKRMPSRWSISCCRQRARRPSA